MENKRKDGWDKIYDMFREQYPSLVCSIKSWSPAYRSTITLETYDNHHFTFGLADLKLREYEPIWFEQNAADDNDDELIKKVLCRNLNCLMNNKQMNCNDLYAITRIPVRTLRNYMYGINTPTAVNLWKIANALGCTTDELLHNFDDVYISDYNIDDEFHGGI